MIPSGGTGPQPHRFPLAKLVKALDKAETIIQHNQGQNPDDFDYEFNLSYGKQYFETNPLLKEMKREIDNDTLKHIQPL